MSSEVSADGNTSQPPKKSNRMLITILVVFGIVLVLGCCICCAVIFLSPRAIGAQFSAIILELECQVWSPELVREECATWVRELKQDHTDDFEECLKYFGRGGPEDFYNCFEEKGLAPQD